MSFSHDLDVTAMAADRSPDGGPLEHGVLPERGYLEAVRAFAEKRVAQFAARR